MKFYHKCILYTKAFPWFKFTHLREGLPVSLLGFFWIPCRLRGHKDQITQVKFLSKHNILVSSSKDTFVRVWDLDIQHCTQVCVWTLAVPTHFF
jgi:WD40 repeat protein